MLKRTVYFIIVGFLLLAFMPSNNWAGPAEIQKLYEAAKAEGEVIWHVIGPAGPWEPVAKKFEEKYPGIKVKPFSHSLSAMPARLITEAQSGRITLDVASCNPQYITALIERGLLEKVDWSQIIQGFNSERLLMDGYLLNITDDPLFWGYNTDLVKKEDVPKSWNDLLDPKWKGHQISIRAMGEQLIGLYPQWLEKPDEVMTFLKKLQAQEIQGAANIGDAFRRVATGECKIGIFRSNEFLTMKNEGAPLGLCPIGPAVVTPTGNILPKNVPHPNAAKLLISWLHSTEGAAVIEEANNRAVITGPDSTNTAKFLSGAGIKFIRIANTAEECAKYLEFEKAANEAMGWGIK
jgi:iron(III) transport system substrate-binding protein